MKLVPMWDRVAIRAHETINGLYLPKTAEAVQTLGRGIVHEVGQGVRKVKPGDDVYYTHPSYGPVDKVSLNGTDYILVAEQFIVARVEE